MLVIGAGKSGRLAALDAVSTDDTAHVVLCDSGPIDDPPAEVTTLPYASATGIFPDCLVALAEADGNLTLVHADHIVIATGAIEEHPVFPGSDLRGILTGRAARAAVAAGIALPRPLVVLAGCNEGFEHARALEADLVVKDPRAGGPGITSATGDGAIASIRVGKTEHPCGSLVVRNGPAPAQRAGADGPARDVDPGHRRGLAARSAARRRGRGRRLPVLGRHDGRPALRLGSRIP